MDDEFNKKLSAAVEERLRAIAGNEEKLVEAWVAQHGWKPDECVLMRQTMEDGTLRMWVEKRGDFDELKRFREREPLVQATFRAIVDAHERGFTVEFPESSIEQLRRALSASAEADGS